MSISKNDIVFVYTTCLGDIIVYDEKLPIHREYCNCCGERQALLYEGVAEEFDYKGILLVGKDYGYDIYTP